MIKIDEYNLSGYKNIESAQLTLNNFNVIIGPNNSGKSNFIQSISFLNHLINSSTDELVKNFEDGFRTTHFNEIAPLGKIQLDTSGKIKGFIDFNLKISNSKTNRIFNYHLVLLWRNKDFGVSYEIDRESLTVKDSNTPGKAISIFNRTRNKVNYGTDLSKTSLFEDLPESFSAVRILKLVSNNEAYLDAVNSLNSVIKAPIFYFSNTELLKANSSERLSEFNGRTVSFDLEEEIIELEEKGEYWEIFKTSLNNILNIEDAYILRFGGNGKTSKKTKDEIKMLRFRHLGITKSIRQLSDGSLLIIAITAKILSNMNSVIFIEEPENSTHPKALIDLIAFFKSFSETKQFIITSHSIAILNKTKIGDIIASSVGKSGLSEFYNVSSRKDLKKKLNQSFVNFSDELFFNDITEDEFEF